MDPDFDLYSLKKYSDTFYLSESFDPRSRIDFHGIESPLPAFEEFEFTFDMGELSLEIDALVGAGDFFLIASSLAVDAEKLDAQSKLNREAQKARRRSFEEDFALLSLDKPLQYENLERCSQLFQRMQKDCVEYILADTEYSLKDYQKQCVHQFQAIRKEGLKGLLSALEMGLGKTIVFIEIALQELINQDRAEILFIGTTSSYLQSMNKMIDVMQHVIYKHALLEFNKIIESKARSYEERCQLFQQAVAIFPIIQRNLIQEQKRLANNKSGSKIQINGVDYIYSPWTEKWLEIREQLLTMFPALLVECQTTNLANSTKTGNPFLDLDIEALLFNADTSQKLKNLPPGKKIVFTSLGKVVPKSIKGMEENAILARFEANRWTLIALDEAHSIDNENSVGFQTFLKYIEKNKGLAESPDFFLMSGTPYENNLADLFTLLKAGNVGGGMFDSVGPYVIHMVKKAAISFGRYIESETNGSSLVGVEEFRDIYTAFSHMEAFKRVLRYFISYKTKTDAEVIKDWQGRIPSKSIELVRCPLTRQQLKLIEEKMRKIGKTLGTEREQKRESSFFKAFEKNKKITTHPDFHKKEETVEENLKDMNVNQIKSWMRQSPKLRKFLPEGIFGKKILNDEAIVIVLDRIKQGKAILTCLKKLYALEDDQIDFLHGSDRDKDRLEMIKRCRSSCSKKRKHILILSLKAGGVGIDLPEVDNLVMFHSHHNPAVTKQAEDRIVRVNSVGTKAIYYLTTETEIERRMDFIRKMKEGMREYLFFFGANNQEGVREALFRFMNVLANELMNNKQKKINVQNVNFLCSNSFSEHVDELIKASDPNKLLELINNVDPNISASREMEIDDVVGDVRKRKAEARVKTAARSIGAKKFSQEHPKERKFREIKKMRRSNPKRSMILRSFKL